MCPVVASLSLATWGSPALQGVPLVSQGRPRNIRAYKEIRIPYYVTSDCRVECFIITNTLMSHNGN